MDRKNFIELLTHEGFSEIVTVSREANGALEMHVHPFEAKALIVQGEIFLQCAGAAEQAYAVGQVFHLAANAPHVERYGAAGVTYLVGRKQA